MNGDDGHPALERGLRDALQVTAPHPDPDFTARVLRVTRATPQRGRFGDWRRLAAAAVLAASVVVGAVVLGPQLGRLGLVFPEPHPGASPLTSGASPTPTLEPLPTVEPSPGATPSPDPSREGRRCENRRDGYSLHYPDGWHTNPELPGSDDTEPVPACLVFGLDPIEQLPHAGPPPGASIIFQAVPEAPPVIGTLIESQQTRIDGRPATIREFEASYPHMAAGARVYQYLIELDTGETLMGWTDAGRAPDYAQARRTLDLMMATLELTE